MIFETINGSIVLIIGINILTLRNKKHLMIELKLAYFDNKMMSYCRFYLHFPWLPELFLCMKTIQLL